jgi:hypothetical protein
MKIFEEYLDEIGTEIIDLTSDESLKILKKWKSIYSPIKNKNKVYAFDFEWQLFDGDFYPSVEGEDAIIKYEGLYCNKYYIFLGDKMDGIFLCTNKNGLLPKFGLIFTNMMVCDNEFNWTMCYTMEGEFGPYFAEKINI